MNNEPVIIDRTRNLDENLVKAMCGEWPEALHPGDREWWVQQARDAIIAFEAWMQP